MTTWYCYCAFWWCVEHNSTLNLFLVSETKIVMLATKKATYFAVNANAPFIIPSPLHSDTRYKKVIKITACIFPHSLESYGKKNLLVKYVIMQCWRLCIRYPLELSQQSVDWIAGLEVVSCTWLCCIEVSLHW